MVDHDEYSSTMMVECIIIIINHSIIAVRASLVICMALSGTQKAVDHFGTGRLNVLVSNAGFQHIEGVHSVPHSIWKKMVCVHALTSLMRHCLLLTHTCCTAPTMTLLDGSASRWLVLDYQGCLGVHEIQRSQS
jgi:NAD(P)-dependent dehydrogenase (short-subunit alcohol dehydrogenase family)